MLVYIAVSKSMSPPEKRAWTSAVDESGDVLSMSSSSSSAPYIARYVVLKTSLTTSAILEMVVLRSCVHQRVCEQLDTVCVC